MIGEQSQDKIRKAVAPFRLRIWIGVLVLLGVLGISILYHWRPSSKEGWTRSNLHAFQIALDRYEVDHFDEGDSYPPDIQVLIHEGLMDAFPINPYTKSPMKEIALGSSPFEGEFTYIPYPGFTLPQGYYLIGYGSKRNEGIDVDGDGVGDHVLLALSFSIPHETAFLPPISTLQEDMRFFLEDPPPLATFLAELKAGSHVREEKYYLYLLHRALEKWGVQRNWTYPSDVQAIIRDGYLAAMPRNPYTKEPMKDIAFGSSPLDGEFTYIPFVQDNEVRGFYLMVYDSKDPAGQDVNGDGVNDHVILIVKNDRLLEGGYDIPEVPDSTGGPEKAVAKINMPPLSELLKAQKENPQTESVVSTEGIR